MSDESRNVKVVDSDQPEDAVEVDALAGGWVSIKVTEDTEEAFVNLNPQAAFKLATGILRLAGHQVLPPRASKEATPATLHGADAEDERQGWNIDALTMAAEYGHAVEFSYQKESGPGGVIERRHLRPERIDSTLAGKLIVQGEDEDRDETRVFRLDRIVGRVEVKA
jgi:predicted DNA-binding transcriptional regulator YafY